MANSSASASEPTPDERRRAILAAILTISAVGTGLSLMLPLLSLELERMGASSTLNGLNTAVGGLANVLIAPLVPVLARRLGQKLFVATALAVLIGSVLAFRLMPNIPVWFVLRFTFGGAIGALFVISEFWIAASAPEDRRGLIMGIYATVLALGFAAGPAALALVGTVGWRPYLACAGLITAALVPLWLVPGRLPAIDDGAHPKVLLLVKAAPIATLAALVFGALESAAFSQLPVFGLRSGLAETSAALLVTWAALGNLAFQIPIGWLSDRVDRRFVLCGCAGLGGLGCLIMLLIPPHGLLFLVLLFVWGGITGAIYTVGLAHLGSRFSGGEIAVANAAFVVLYSLGMTVGPPLAGMAMDLAGAPGLPLGLGAMLLAYALMAARRIAQTLR